MSCKTVGLILAAGFSERFGPADKRAYRLSDGRSLLAHSVDAVARCFDDWRLVIRDDDCLQALGLGPDTPVIQTRRASEGQASSLADGLSALLASEYEAAAVFLGDMPYLRHDTIDHLRQYAAADAIVRPTCKSQPGHPVLIGREFWPKLSQCHGERAGPVRLKNLTTNYREIPVDDEGVYRDIDTPDCAASTTP